MFLKIDFEEIEVTQGYHFERGRVSGEGSGMFVLASGVVVQKKRLVGTAFMHGQEVIISWQSTGNYPECFNGVRYVDPDAIERVGAWTVENRYRATFHNSREQLGFFAEDRVIHQLIADGIRAEKSTPFEDEKLGVDIWLFLKIDGAWSWFPVDLTLRDDMDTCKSGNKFDKGFEKGVLAVHVNGRSVMENPAELTAWVFAGVNVALMNFRNRNKKILTRFWARKRESQFK